MGLARPAEVLLRQGALVDRRVRRRRVRHGVRGAVVEDRVGEDVRARAAAKVEPRRRVEDRIAVEAEVADLRVEIVLRPVRHAGRGLEALLRALRLVAARDVAELELWPLAERVDDEPRVSAR